MLKEPAMHRHMHLKRVPPITNNPFSTLHLHYSARWQRAGATLSAILMATVLATPADKRLPLLRWLVCNGTAAGFGMLSASHLNTLRLQVQQHSLAFANLPPELDGLRIAHLSDFHFGPYYARRATRQALAAVQAYQPHLIALTGDFVDTLDDLGDFLDVLRPLNAPLGIWACLGNHDYWTGPAEIATALEGIGIEVLINEHRLLTWGDARLAVAGVPDPWYGSACLEQALDGVPADVPILLLAHGPDYITIAAQQRVALQLSGHAHGGHLNLPLLGPFVLPRWGVRYPAGCYRVDDSWLYVSRGLGGLPLRLGALPEATLLTLQRR